VLHSYSPSEGLRAHDDATLTPNGIAWTADGATMFLAHSKEHRVFTFAFDARAGRLGERRLFAAIPDDMGVPDGAALDSEGCYWSAIHRGGRLRRYRPDGQLDREIMMPVSCPTMCSFAGPALDTLYITTASHGSSAEPHAGALYRCRPGVTGLAKPNYAV
jgi:sugar lactone lactonase YvrE